MKLIGIITLFDILSAVLFFGCDKNNTGSDSASAPTGLIEIKSAEVCNITGSSVQSGGQVLSKGNLTVSERGVSWNTLPGPTINDNFTEDGSGSGEFISSIHGLRPGIIYYLRAYAKTGDIILYGDEKIFRTNDISGLTGVTTSVSYNFTQHSIEAGGQISNIEDHPATEKGICWVKLNSPYTANHLTVNEDAADAYYSMINGLEANTTYEVMAYVKNDHGISYGNKLQITTLPEFIQDVEGTNYPVILIGSQLWMAKNLETSRFANGDIIPSGLDIDAISVKNKPEFWFTYNDSTRYEYDYGKLYTWYTLNDSRNICPDGWHIPNDNEWQTMINFLGDKDAGGKMKEPDLKYWMPVNIGADNSSGFSGRGGGSRRKDSYQGIRQYGGWWSSSQDRDSTAWTWYLSYHLTVLIHSSHPKYYGASVRCMKD